MKVGRRIVLRGIGGTVLALPFLESIGLPDASSGVARAQDMRTPPYAIFFRQANGVAQAQRNDEIGDEPERFWPRMTGALTMESLAGRALEELAPFRSKLLVVKGVDMQNFDYGDGHARGALQCLTGRGPTVTGAGGDSEAAGMSLDHLIGQELNEGGRESMFMYAGQRGGWLGGPCISYRGPASRRTAIHDPWMGYQSLVGGSAGMSELAQRQLVERRQSINDLVRGQMDRLLSRPQLSTHDRMRIEQHRAALRDLETGLTCGMSADRERALMGAAPGFDSTDGDEVLEAARLHMEVAAIAVGCGHTRSVAIQIGSGNDGSTRYRDPDTGSLMENFHFLSHRRQSHGSDGAIIAGSDLLHHKVDRQFAQTFRHLLEHLDAIALPSEGRTLLDAGVSVWLNDLSSGPPHGRTDCPFILAGSADGYFLQGQHVDLPGTGVNHAQMLNTIGTAVGVRTPGQGELVDFGDPSLPGGTLAALRA